VPRSAMQLRRCHVRAVVRTLVGTRANARKMALAGHVMRCYVCLLCTIGSDNTRSSLLPILGRRNLVKLMFTKYIMFEQNELVRQYTLYYSAFCIILSRNVPSVMELSHGDGDGSGTKCGGDSLMQINEVYIYVYIA
jgi:hypothetical protein